MCADPTHATNPSGFADDSALLKHECAYCLGQMQDDRALPVLTRVLEDSQQDVMVRHEAGEALGAIGNPAAKDVLTVRGHIDCSTRGVPVAAIRLIACN
jgi:hypothetical protein